MALLSAFSLPFKNLVFPVAAGRVGLVGYGAYGWALFVAVLPYCFMVYLKAF